MRFAPPEPSSPPAAGPSPDPLQRARLCRPCRSTGVRLSCTPSPRLGDGEQGLTSGDGVTGGGVEADDAPGIGAGEFDDGLRGLDLDDHLIDVDLVADGDLPRD